MSESRRPSLARPTIAIALITAATAVALWWLGRRWWCACGESWLVTAEAYDRHTSQHLLDPYSVTHVLHGIGFWWIVWPFARQRSDAWRGIAVMLLEAAWEVLENTPAIIARYRTETAALGYEGDTIVNALADSACCGVGAWLAAWTGFRWSLVVFIAAELLLAWWIRDNLTLNIQMLLWPLESVRVWQAGHG